MKSKQLLGVFLVMGVFAGVGYWLYLYYSNPEDAPSVGDFLESIKSYVRQAYNKVTTILPFEDNSDSAGNSVDPAVAKAVKIIAAFEGYSAKPYNDQGKQAIGYGHDFVQGDGFSSGSHLTESEAWGLLESDVESRFAPVVDRNVSVELTENQKAALISFCYNVGAGAFQSSTLLKLVNQGNFDAAAGEFSRWTLAGGEVNDSLVKRRQQEQALFLS